MLVNMRNQKREETLILWMTKIILPFLWIFVLSHSDHEMKVDVPFQMFVTTEHSQENINQTHHFS